MRPTNGVGVSVGFGVGVAVGLGAGLAVAAGAEVELVVSEDPPEHAAPANNTMLPITKNTVFISKPLPNLNDVQST